MTLLLQNRSMFLSNLIKHLQKLDILDIIITFATNNNSKLYLKMKLLKRIAVVIIMLAAVLPASAQFSFGPRVGINVNKLHLDETTFSTDNRAGFTAGLQMEFMIPMLNLGLDLSAMYVRRSAQFEEKMADTDKNYNSDYIEIPLNLKYKFGLPVVGKIITPYIFTGPSFAFLTSKKAISEFFNKKKCDIAWNFGLGVQLIKHLQVSASYGLGLSKVVEYTDKNFEKADINGKNRYWTITAAWLF